MYISNCFIELAVRLKDLRMIQLFFKFSNVHVFCQWPIVLYVSSFSLCQGKRGLL